MGHAGTLDEEASALSTLIVVGGLPGSGKSTVAAAYIRASGAAYLRIDTIEQTIRDHTSLTRPLGPVGYEVGYALAGEQLRLGTPVVVAECVNPLTITRDAWRRTAMSASALLVDVDVVCSDRALHRHRVETRTGDVPGLALPTWQDVLDREYQPRDERDRLVVDTARDSPETCAQAIADAVEHSARAARRH